MLTYAYICADFATDWESALVRATPSINGQRAGALSTFGTMAQWVETAENNGAWDKYIFPGGESGWLRQNAIKRFAFGDGVVHSLISLVGFNNFYQWAEPDADDFPNDCGPAALAAVLGFYHIRRTVDQVSKVAGLKGRSMSGIPDLVTAATKGFKLNAERVRPLHVPDILKSITDGRPVICLVNNDFLEPGENYGHFVTAVGFIQTGFSLDIITANPAVDSPNVTYNSPTFAQALGRGQQVGNMPWQGIIFKDNPPSDDLHSAYTDLSAISDSAKKTLLSL